MSSLDAHFGTPPSRRAGAGEAERRAELLHSIPARGGIGDTENCFQAENCTQNCTQNFKKDGQDGKYGIVLQTDKYLIQLQFVDIVEKFIWLLALS